VSRKSRKTVRGVKSIETKHHEQREEVLNGLRNLDRRSFLRLSAAAFGAAMGAGALRFPHTFQPVSIANAAGNGGGFRFAYISDSHLYERDLNDRFVTQLLRAVDDVQRLDPKPDFVIYGGDLAQLGQPKELELGAQILGELDMPVKMMVGEHDWYLDMGEKWRELFGDPTYSFDHKGVHFVTLNSVIEEDFWTERGMSPMERMKTVAGLDNGIQSRFEVGAEQREWLRRDLEAVDASTPVVVFSHSPLYHYYEPWNFWTKDAAEIQSMLHRFDSAVVIHGHTHQLLTHRIGNIHFHGMLSTAWPWPYAPEGLPELTVQMNRPDPFDPHDGLGAGSVRVNTDGYVDKLYDLWNRNPIEVSAGYVASNGSRNVPSRPSLTSY